MKKNKAVFKSQRRALDQKIAELGNFENLVIPKKGWIKIIRESLGMTLEQLAQRIGVVPSNVAIMEKREVEKKLTLETIERAAEALGCRFVYMFVPKKSLEKMVQDQAEKAASEILQNVHHHMKLERQNVSSDTAKEQAESLAFEIKEKMDSRLWGSKTRGKKK